MNPMVVLSSILAAASAQYIPYANNFGYAPYAVAPQAVRYAAPVAAAPVVAAPAIPYAPSSQFQAQDEFGNVNYGYSNINSQKHEIGNAYGGVTGGYSYVDANGELQRVEYIADAAGFRVKATNLPVAPAVPEVKAADLPVAPVFEGKAPVFDGVAPSPVEKTAEVLEAEAAFFKKFEEAASRTKRSVIAPYGAFPYAANYAYNGYNGYATGYPYAANYAYAPYAANYAYPAVATTQYAGLAPVEAATPAATVKAVPAVQTVVSAPYAAPYAAAYAPAQVAYAAPQVAVAGEEAVLETVKLNPGHATAYRVY